MPIIFEYLALIEKELEIVKMISQKETNFGGFAFVLQNSNIPDSTQNEKESTVSFNLDINIWVNSGNKCDIDFGIKIPSAEKAHQLIIYIPFYIQATDIIDLHHLLQNRNIAHGIFDENITIHESFDDDTVYIDNHADTSTLACISLFGSREQATVDYSSGDQGSIVRIDLSSSMRQINHEYDYIYFRFRIPFFPFEVAMRDTRDYRETLTNPFVSYDTTMLIGINEARQVPPPIQRLIYQEKSLIDSIHIILVSDRKWCISLPFEPYRIRQLEDGIWDDYWPQLKVKQWLRKRSASNYLVYQWALNKPYESGRGCSFYVRLTKRVMNVRSLLFYLFIIFSINIITGLISSYISYQLFN